MGRRSPSSVRRASPALSLVKEKFCHALCGHPALPPNRASWRLAPKQKQKIYDKRKMAANRI
jgi:hypothetical protein